MQMYNKTFKLLIFSYFYALIENPGMEKTFEQYGGIMDVCREVFLKKMKDYGTAWRILRPVSITDQIYIKARRIRSIEEKKVQKVEDDIRSEFIGIINYALMGIIQLNLGPSEEEMNPAKAIELYNQYCYTDLILMKIRRTKQIEDNQGETIMSEGIDANYYDMVNYAVFALIKI